LANENDTSNSTVVHLKTGWRGNSSPRECRLPIQANERQREAIKTDPTTGLDHLLTLNDLVLAHDYDDEKARIFGLRTSDPAIHDLLDTVLDMAILEVQRENATVVGLVVMTIQTILESHRGLRKHVFGPGLEYGRSSDEIRAEVACVSRTAARLQKELEAALASERDISKKGEV
jgi:hypothetical protein